MAGDLGGRLSGLPRSDVGLGRRLRGFLGVARRDRRFARRRDERIDADLVGFVARPSGGQARAVRLHMASGHRPRESAGVQLLTFTRARLGSVGLEADRVDVTSIR